jgi:hypothetical protein
VNFAPEFGEIVHHEALHLGNVHADEGGRVARLEEVNPVVEILL